MTEAVADSGLEAEDSGEPDDGLTEEQRAIPADDVDAEAGNTVLSVGADGDTHVHWRLLQRADGSYYVESAIPNLFPNEMVDPKGRAIQVTWLRRTDEWPDATPPTDEQVLALWEPKHAATPDSGTAGA